MAINTPVDPMAILEEEMTKAAQQSQFKPFLFILKDGEKALVHLLLNLNQYIPIRHHEKFNPGIKKYDVNAVCAADFGQECQLCLDAESDKKLKAAKRFYLPVYMHAVQKYDAQSKQWVPSIYTDQEGNEMAIKGVRILEMKASSSILSDLVANYNESDSHDLTTVDFVIARKGSGIDTEYTVTLKPQMRALPPDVPAQSREQIKSDIELARPMRAVGGNNGASSNGKGDDGIPEF